MNWFVTENMTNRSVADKKESAEQDGQCPHVEKDPSVAVANRKEMDTWGPVATYVCCAECLAAAQEAEGERTQHCVDCGKEHKVKDGIRWKWYDFYAPQGDEALCVCNACRTEPKHQARLERDAADQAAEDEYNNRF